MRVKTVLTYWDGSPAGDQQLQAAIDTAQWFDAALHVASVAYEHDLTTCSDPGGLARGVISRRAIREAGKRTRQATAHIQNAGLDGEAFPMVATRASLPEQFALLEREADVVVQLRPPSETTKVFEDRFASRSETQRPSPCPSLLA
ncbi:hypothetical protein [Salipiger mucosus]|uniref:hypothetical protein n=1 Tax=Salipiger mucosus TaxID=263378 RepID=UPI00036A2610|nr:hypothetical protein [Salipiger mucosus]